MNRTEMMTLNRLLTAPEVAHWLAVSPSWIRDHASGRRRPVLPSIKIGRSMRFEEKSITEWLEVLHRDGRAA
jgi:predicted DNA-binding transcriptional regulator AlpA